MFISPLYSNILDPAFPNLKHFKDIIRYDYSLFRQKLDFHKFDLSNSTFKYFAFSHLPFFIGSVSFGPNNLPPINEIIKDDSITHYATTHQGRRRFKRLPTVYHLHRNLVEVLLPLQPTPTCEEASKIKCPYRCREFHQSCSWHFNLPYDPALRNDRELLFLQLQKLNLVDDSCFWLSLAQVYLDQSYFCVDPSRLEKSTHLMLNRRLDHPFPHTIMVDDARLQSATQLGYWMEEEECFKSYQDYFDVEMMPIQQTQADTDDTWRCVSCDLSFPSRASYRDHLSSQQHTDSLPPDPLPLHLEDNEPVSFSRSYVTSKLSDLMNALSDAKDALPLWLKQHTRFLVNLLCNCVTIMTSKAWPAVIAAISSMVNEVLHEFPQLLKERVDALVKCFKQVIWRYFPHAQAQPTAEHDHHVANESFIKSLFSILTSLLPGVTVDAQLLKARVQRIQLLSTCLTSARHIGEWFCMIFDKLWTWIQIYWYGATSEDLARAQALYASPEIATWINDVTAFELGGKTPDGRERPPGVTRLLVDTELQDRVVELRKQGEDILKTITSSDQTAKTRLTVLVQTHLRKVDKWYKMFEDSRGLAENKHEPFVIYLYGDPGIGKTYCVNYICQILAQVVGRDFDPARDIFAKPRDSPYHDGYNNQFCYLLDDFLQVSSEDGNASEISFLIDAGSRAKYHLHVAAQEKKATSYFTSPLIMVTSNRQLNYESFDQMVASFPALARRIDLSIEVRRDPAWKPDPALVFDPRGMFFEMSRFKFVKDNKYGGVWEPLGQACDWNMMVHTAAVLFARKMKRQGELDHMEPVPERLAASLRSTVNLYRDSTGTDTDVVRALFATESVPAVPTWARKVRDPNTNGFQRKEMPIALLRGIRDDRETWSLSPCSSITSLDIERDCHSDAEVALERMTREIEQVENTVSQLETSVADMQVTQADESSDIHLFCPARGCGVGFPLGTTRAEVFLHCLRAAHHLTHDGDAHNAAAQQYRTFLSGFPAGDNEPLSRSESSWYGTIQGVYYDYEPRGSPYSISECAVAGHFDLVRVLIALYQEFDHCSVWRSVVNWPTTFVSNSVNRMRSAMSSVMAKAFSPIRPVVELVNEAKGIVDKIKANIGKIAIIGVVFTIFSSVVSMCLLRWLSSRNSAPLTVPPAKVPLKQEAFVSGDLKTSARRKKMQKVEDSEAFVSGDLKVAARKKRMQRVECACCSSVPFTPVLSAVTVRKVEIDASPDLIVASAKDKITLRWNTGEEQSLDWKDDYIQRSIDISKVIAAHYDQSEAQETEAKQDRMMLVDNLIGKYPVTEAARDPAAMDIIQNLGPNMIKVHNMKNGLTLNGVIVENSIAMFPRHLLGEEACDGLPLMITTMEGQTMIVLGGDYRWIECPEKDTIFVDLTATHLHSRRSIAKKFIHSDVELRISDGYLLVPNYDNTKTRLNMVTAKQLLTMEPLERTEYFDTKKKESTHVIGALHYKGDSQPGDCGSLVIKVDPSSVRKIMGFHVAGSKGDGTAMLWTEEKIRECLASFQQTQAVVDVEFNHLDLDDFYDCKEFVEEDDFLDVPLTYCEPLGMIPRELAPGCPLTSSLQPSPIFEQLIPTKSGPSTLRPFVNSAGEEKFPLKLALEKLESPLITFDESLVDRCARRMIVDYCKKGRLTWYGEQKNGKLSDLENVLGVESDPWIKPVNMKTSPGYPYVLAGDKKKFINADTGEMHPTLVRAMKEREEKCKQSQQYPALMVDVLKDERLSNDKREKGKVRIFNVCPLDFNLLVRKYFTRFMAQMMNQHVDGEVSVGLNVHSDDWQAFFTCLEKSGSHWIAGDYSAWDKRMPLPIAMSLLPLVEQFYQQFDDYDPDDANVRRTLLLQAFQSVRLAQTQEKGLLYRVHQSMPSGIAVTAVYNSLINALLFRVIYAELAVESGMKVAKAVNGYSSNVRFAAYGDDHIARVSEMAYPFFNMLSISKQMARHHITYTAASKGDVEGPEVGLADLTYLKRKFVKRSGRLDAPMELEAILDILNWVNVQTPLDASEASEAAIKSVLIELSHHSKEVFNEWYFKIFKVATRNNLTVPETSYDEVVHKRRYEEFDLYENFY